MRKNYKVLFLFVLQFLWLNHTMLAYETPTMGWSSWNTYGLNISDQLIREQADAMVSTGLKDAGHRLLRA